MLAFIPDVFKQKNEVNGNQLIPKPAHENVCLFGCYPMLNFVYLLETFLFNWVLNVQFCLFVPQN